MRSVFSYWPGAGIINERFKASVIVLISLVSYAICSTALSKHRIKRKCVDTANQKRKKQFEFIVAKKIYNKFVFGIYATKIQQSRSPNNRSLALDGVLVANCCLHANSTNSDLMLQYVEFHSTFNGVTF